MWTSIDGRPWKWVPRVLGLSVLAIGWQGCSIAPRTARGSYDREVGAYVGLPGPAQGSPETWKGFRQTGEISYYAKKFEGNRTASGEPYRGGDFTAAHRELPFGTRVKVTHLKNGKSVTVRVNDRGPFAKDRILDVSLAAAKHLGLMQSGTADAQIEVVSP
jgi:rare lipoprotein A